MCHAESIGDFRGRPEKQAVRGTEAAKADSSHRNPFIAPKHIFGDSPGGYRLAVGSGVSLTWALPFSYQNESGVGSPE